MKHLLKMNASTQTSVVPEAAASPLKEMSQGIKEKQVELNDYTGEFITT